MLDLAPIRALYDHHMRQHLRDSAMMRTATDNVVRYIMPQERFGMILYADLNSETVDAAIQAQIEYFSQIGYAFEWKYFDYDQPPHLPERLAAHHLIAEPTEAVMVLPIATMQPPLTDPINVDIRQLNRHTVHDADIVHQAVWGVDDKAPPSRLAHYAWEKAPDNLIIFAAYVDDAPVAYARLETQANNPFAYLFAGATLPQYRRRGLYTALVAARLQVAHERGCRYLVVDAMPNTSMPIVKKLGFYLLAMSTPYQWLPPADE